MANGLIFATPPTPPTQTAEQRVLELELQNDQLMADTGVLHELANALEVEVVRTRQLVALLLRDWGEHETYETTLAELEGSPGIEWDADLDEGRFRVRPAPEPVQGKGEDEAPKTGDE